MVIPRPLVGAKGVPAGRRWPWHPVGFARIRGELTRTDAHGFAGGGNLNARVRSSSVTSAPVRRNSDCRSASHSAAKFRRITYIAHIEPDYAMISASMVAGPSKIRASQFDDQRHMRIGL